MTNAKPSGSPDGELERRYALSLLTAGIVHELTNPLNAILMNAELGLLCLQQQSATTEELTDILRTIATEARRGGELAKNLSNFSRSSNYEPTTTASLNDAVQQARNLLGSEPQRRNIALEMHLAETMPETHLNSIAIALMVTGLINAAMNNGASRIQLSTMHDEHGVCFELRDDGQAIAEINEYPDWIINLAQQVTTAHHGEFSCGTDTRFKARLAAEQHR